MELKKVISNIKRLYKNYVKKRLWRVFAALFFSVIIAGTTSAIAWLLDPAVKKIFIDNDRTFAVLIPIAIVVVFTAKGASLYAARNLILTLGYRVIQEIQSQMAEHVLLSDTQNLESKHSGRHITSFMYDVAQIQSLISTGLLNFCALDLSSFYFDIRKDVLYCDDLSSKKRKSCIDLLNVILECLIKWYAPVLSFTTEEIAELAQKGKKTSIHEENFPEIPDNWKNESLSKKWEKLLHVRQQVNIGIEEKRSSKIIGSSLEADVEIALPKAEFDILQQIDAKELFITSNVIQNISKENEISITVKKAKGTKCSRCWKIVEKVKDNKCSRCLKIK